MSAFDPPCPRVAEVFSLMEISPLVDQYGRCSFWCMDGLRVTYSQLGRPCSGGDADGMNLGFFWCRGGYPGLLEKILISLWMVWQPWRAAIIAAEGPTTLVMVSSC